MYLITILAAFLQSTKDAMTKNLSVSMNPYTLSVGVGVAIILSNLPLLFFSNPDFSSFQLDLKFWIILIIMGVGFAASSVAINLALKISDLSLTAPLTSFSSLFTLLFELLIFGSIPKSWALVGVLIVFLGTYLLKVDFQKKDDFLKPIKALIKDKGAQLMVLVSFSWALDNILSKIGSIQTDPIFWNIVTRLIVILILFPIALKTDKKWFLELKQNWLFIFLMGVIVGISMSLANYALVSISPSISATLFRTNAIFSVLYGIFVFKEKQALSRLVGASIMFLGVTLIVLGF